MKIESKILIAGSIGLFAVLGIIGIRKFLENKHDKYKEYYSDFHRHFEKNSDYDESHGVEFLSMR